MFTLTCTYYATGEGLSEMILITDAASKEDALEEFADLYDPYYLPGVDIYEGINLDNPVAKKLISEDARRGLQMAGHVHYNCSLHINLS